MMASGRIKGLTIEINGDATGLDKALKSTMAEISNTKKQLNDVNRLLKIDPGNTELLQQKHKLLGNELNSTKDKLIALKDAEKQVQEQFKNGSVSGQQYDALKREIIATENELKNLEKEARNSNATLSKISSVSNNVASSSKNVAGAMAPFTLAIAAAGTASFKYASDTNEALNKTEVAFGNSSDAVKKFAETSLDSYGIAKGTALDMSALFGDMATSMGMNQSKASEMATSLTGLAGDLSSFKNIGLDQAMSALNGIFTGETESLKSIGVVMTQTNLDAYALANGFGKTTSEMTEAEKVSLRYAYVMDKTKNAQGDFSRTGDQAANTMRVAQESLKELASSFGEALLPIITPVIKGVSDVVKWFKDLDDTTKNVIMVVLGLIAAIGPIAGLISSVATVVGALSAAIAFFTGTAGIASIAGSVLTGVIGFLTSPITLTIAAIAGLIAICVALYQNWDEVCAFASELWNNICTTVSNFVDGLVENIRLGWQMIGESISTKCTDIANFISETWNNIVNAVAGFLNGIKDWVVNKFNEIINWLGSLPGRLYEAAVNMFNYMKQGVVNTVGGVYDSVVNGIQSAIDWILGLPGEALQWGSDFIDGFVSGIQNAVGGLFDAVGGIADGIASFLHFSRPDKGPLHFYEEWMPDFIGGLAKGIHDNIGLIENASANVASTLTVGNDTSNNKGVQNQSTGVGNVFGEMRSMITDLISNVAPTDNTTYVMPVYIGNRLIDEVVIDANARNLVKSGGH